MDNSTMPNFCMIFGTYWQNNRKNYWFLYIEILVVFDIVIQNCIITEIRKSALTPEYIGLKLYKALKKYKNHWIDNTV